MISGLFYNFLFGADSRPYRSYVPQSVKIYPIHLLLPTMPPPRIGEWSPVMRRDTARYLATFGSNVSLGRQLYMHIPFCPAFCHFCCLYKTMDPAQQDADYIEAFVRSLLEEIRVYGERVPAARSRPVTSIYFGGGTPSMLSIGQVERILDAIAKHLPVVTSPEITFEGMAHQLKDVEYLRALCKNGINRISYGVQTFQPHLRKQLGRLDTVKDIFEAAEAIRGLGKINALNFELLMGIPGQDWPALRDDLEKSVQARPHTLDLLFYNAVPGTKYYDMIRDGSRTPQIAGDALLDMRKRAIEFFQANGYHHATGEIFDEVPDRLDNFNETHYGGSTGLDEMLSLGPSSYGFIEGTVYQNVTPVSKYMDLLKAGRLPIRAWQAISARQARRRGLLFGIQLRRIRREVVSSIPERLLVNSWEHRGLVTSTHRGWELTALGKIWYNMMQLEAMPLHEAGSALDLALDPSEQRRLLFNPQETRGNIALARELERIIEGPTPLLRPVRRGAYQLLSSLPIPRPRVTFAGPESTETN